MAEASSPRLWRDPDWRLFWLSTTVSVFGSQVSALAIPLPAIETLNASAFQIGALNASMSFPFLSSACWRAPGWTGCGAGRC